MKRAYNLDYKNVLRRFVTRKHDGAVIVKDFACYKMEILYTDYGLCVANDTNSWPVTLKPTGYLCDADNLPLYAHRALRRLGETFGSNDALRVWLDATLKEKESEKRFIRF